MANVEVRPILSADVSAACAFLRANLNPRIAESAWRGLFAPPWDAAAPNHGFQLVDDGRIVGVYVAVYSQRRIGATVRSVCNLAAFCVLEDFRVHSFRLLRALLRQKEFTFTDLSPSGNVVALNERLGFVSLDPSTRISANVPAPPRSGLEVSSDPGALERGLSGECAVIYRDHRRAAAAHHVIVRAGERVGYIVARRDRRKRLPLFASVLFAGGDRELLREAWPQVRTQLLLRLGAVATLSDPAVLGFSPARAKALKSPRPRMFKTADADLSPTDIDYLYSELVLLAW